MSFVEYIAVPFNEENSAKKLGAQLDTDSDRMYIPDDLPEDDKLKLLIKYPISNAPIIYAPKENRHFKNELCVDLTPTTVYHKSIDNYLDRHHWNRIKNKVFSRANNKCELCNADNVPLEVCERWDYETEIHTRYLVNLIAHCDMCKKVNDLHLNSNELQAKEHLCKVRNFTNDEYNKHIDEAVNVLRNRSKYNWSSDMSLVKYNLFIPADIVGCIIS
jgi:hypothetical protein